jgi:bacterioferritin-associated ferredoxin
MIDSDFLDSIDQLDDYMQHDNMPIQNSDFLLCECNVLSLKDIKNFIHEQKVDDLDQLCHLLKLGSGCGSCLKNYKSTLLKLLKNSKDTQ